MGDLTYEEIKDKLEKELNTVEWPSLKPHYDREALLLLEPGYDIVELGARVAMDDTSFVKELLDSKKLLKSEDIDIEEKESKKHRQYVFIIVQPFVFAQEIKN